MRLTRIWVAVLLVFGIAVAGTTGKISGFVRDANTGESLPGANVLLKGTNLGAAANAEGYYVILSVPPGSYELVATYVGYAKYEQTNVRVMLDRLTEANFDMLVEAFKGQEVVVTAKRDVIRKDVAGGQMNVSSDEISALPATSIADVTGLKAGVSGLSVRGGGSDETSFMLDGIAQRDARTNQPVSSVPLSSVSEVSVQTGGFSVQYDDARSGIISVATKEGSKEKYELAINYRMSPAASKSFGSSVYDPDAYWLFPYVNDDVCWDGVGAAAETYTDLNGNGEWDAHEPFEDSNGNYEWDATISDYDRDQLYGNYFEGWEAVSGRTIENSATDDDLTSSAAQQVFRYQHRKDGQIYANDYNVDLGFGGPVPLVGKALGNMRFYFSYLREREMYLIPLTTDGYYNQTGLLKVTSDLSNKAKLSFTGKMGNQLATIYSNVGSASYFDSAYDVANSLERSGFTVPWRIFSDSYWSVYRQYNNMYSLKYTQQLTETSYFDASASVSSVWYESGPNEDRDRETMYEIVPGYYLDEQPFGYYASDNAWDLTNTLNSGGSVGQSRDSTRTSSYNLEANYMNQLNENNELKAGFKFAYEDINMEYGAANELLPDGNFWTSSDYNPYRLSLWAEDKLEFEGLYATFGLKAQYFDANCSWYNPDTWDASFFQTDYTPGRGNEIPDSLMIKVDPKLYVTPVFSVSHPISENAKLFFNYGHFIQRFNTQTLYRYTFNTGTNNLEYLGDPSSPFEKTIAYELGFDMSFADMYLLHFSAYYKDISDQMSWTYYEGNGGQINYRRIDNRYYQDIRGFELELSKRVGDWLSGWANYEYRVSTSGYFGVGEVYDNPTDQNEYLEDNPYQSKPKPTPRAKAYIDIHTPGYLDNELLQDWHLALIASWTSGSWTTWNPKNAQEVGGAIISSNLKYKDYYNLNMKLSKKFRLADNLSVKLFVDVNNALNIKRYSSVSYYNTYDYYDYMYSLHFAAEDAEPLNYDNIPGSDQPGDYRDYDVEYVQMDYVDDIATGIGEEGILYYNAADADYYKFENGIFVAEDNAVVDEVLKTKAYIDMPALEPLTFLNPRDIFFGINLSLDL